jgi:hypothetical protein
MSICSVQLNTHLRYRGNVQLKKRGIMKIKIPGRYTTAAVFLLSLSGILFAIALLSDLGDTSKAAFVISGTACAMTGIFTLTFSAGEPVVLQHTAILPIQGSINMCQITKHLGMHGNAYFLPPGITGETRVMQFNPTSTDTVNVAPAKGSFREKGPAGLVTIPSSDVLTEDLKKRNAMVVPNNREHITLLLRETIEDILKFAPRVSYRWSGNTVTITFHNYVYIDGCKVIGQKCHPKCCAMSPCPVCSLCGSLIAEGLDTVVTLDRCSAGSITPDVTSVFTVVPYSESS